MVSVSPANLREKMEQENSATDNQNQRKRPSSVHHGNVFYLEDDGGLKNSASTDPERQLNDPEKPILQPDPHHDESVVHTHTTRSILIGIAIATCMGFMFGLVFEKSRVFEPVVIREQFLFQRWMMLEMFLSAMAASAFSLLLICLLAPKTFAFARNAYHGCFHRGVFTAVVPGSFLLGAGMALGGGCPGMVTSQLGAGVSTAYATFIGCLVGALVYGLLEPVLENWIAKGPKFSRFYADKSLGIKYRYMAGGLTLFAIAGILVIEFVVPQHQRTVGPNQPDCKVFGCRSWPTWTAGLLLGLLQLPATLVIRDTLGSSTAYSALTSLSTHAMPDDTVKTKFKRFASQRLGWYSWWQVIYLIGAVMGALCSSFMSNTFATVTGIHQLAGFFGGFLMLFGSRLAGGCTSGHGISGMTLLNNTSIIAVPSMFAGGIVVAFLYQYIDPNHFPDH